LTKGPVMFVLLLVPLLVYTRLEPRCPRIAFRDWLLFGVLAVALAAPWYVGVMLREPAFAHTFVWRHHVERFLIPFDHEKPAWFYLPGLLAGMLPWSLLLPGFVRYLGRRSLRAARRRPPALGFFLLAALTCLIFFSASGCKRPAYILPAMPALALALGCYLNCLLPRVHRGAATGWQFLWQWRSPLAWQATLLVLALAFVLLTLAGSRKMLRPGLGLSLLALVGIALAWLLVRRRVSWGVCAAVTFAVLTGGVYYLQPAYNRQFALRDQLHVGADLANAECLPVACYPQRWDSVSYYLPRAEVHVFTQEQRKQLLEDLRSREQTLLVIKSGRLLEELLRELPDGVEFVAKNRQGAVTAGWVRPRADCLVCK
jgi:dolichol-phosphate mannosyltransferase